MKSNNRNLNDMEFNNLKNEYPVIPEDIRVMIEHEVNNQMKETLPARVRKMKTGKTPWKKVIAAALIATIAVGTTTFAGSKLYRWQTQKESNYGLKAGIATDHTAESGTSKSETTASVPEEIPVLSFEATYLPDGMIAANDGSDKYFYEANPYQGGVSITASAMDQELSEENFPVATHITACESIKINGMDAIYLEKADHSFDKNIYIAYPGYWQIVEMYFGDDVTKEEAIKIAEGLNVQTTGENRALADTITWSDSINPEVEYVDAYLSATNEDMKNMHDIGEAFPITTSAATPDDDFAMVDGLEAKVTDIQVADDLSLLNNEFADPDLFDALDSNGKLVNNTIKYIKSGDGLETIDEEIRSEEVAQKLVYATIEYTNTGDTELKDILFFASFIGLTQNNDGYTIYDRALCDDDETTDSIACSSIGKFGEMDYYDIHSGERNNNYIPSLQPGESVTIHVAKVVNEDELDKMYLSLDSSGSAYEFSEDSLNTGYVDIRQTNISQ